MGFVLAHYLSKELECRDMSRGVTIEVLVILVGVVFQMPWLPHSLEKVVPILVLQFENDPLFCGKTLTFQLKMTPFLQ